MLGFDFHNKNLSLQTIVLMNYKQPDYDLRININTNLS